MAFICTKHQVLRMKTECASFDKVLGRSCRHMAGSFKTFLGIAVKIYTMAKYI